MAKTKLVMLAITMVLIGCKLPTVGYFKTQPFLKAYKTDVDKNMTIVLDAVIPDSLTIKSPGVNKMTIKQFRKTLEDALESTFKDTYKEVNKGNTYSQKGISLVLIKATPYWNKKSSRTIVTGTQGNTSSSTLYELEAKVTYQAILYSEGEKIGVIDGIALSEKTTFKRKQTPEVLQDGVKVMCEEIYKQTTTYK